MYDRFVPTITTLTGSFRNMKAWIPKQHSIQLKNTAQVQIYGFRSSGDSEDLQGVKKC